MLARGGHQYYYARRQQAAAVMGVPFTPLLLSPAVWYDVAPAYCYVERTGGGTTLSSIDGVVGTIRDRSGNDRHWVATSDAARPLLKQSGALYYLQFDGADDRMSVSVSLALPVYRVAALRQITWSSGERLAYGGVAASYLAQAGTTPQIGMYNGSTFGALNGNLAVGTAGVVTETWAAGGLSLQIDNTTATTHTVGSAGTQTTFETGDATFFGNFDYFGGVAISGTLSAPNLALLKTYLGTKCGIVV